MANLMSKTPNLAIRKIPTKHELEQQLGTSKNPLLLVRSGKIRGSSS